MKTSAFDSLSLAPSRRRWLRAAVGVSVVTTALAGIGLVAASHRPPHPMQPAPAPALPMVDVVPALEPLHGWGGSDVDDPDEVLRQYVPNGG